VTASSTPAAAAAVSATASGGAASRTSPTPVASAEQPKAGGDATLGLVGTLRDFDPHRSLSDFSAAGLMVATNLAIELDPRTYQLVPAIVAQWETSGNGTGYVLTVRQDARWHNKPPVGGRSVDAQDVAYNLMRIAAKLPGDNPAERPRASTLAGMDKAEATDSSHVRITMASPNSSFLVGVTTYTNTLVPREMPSQLGFDDPSKFIGSGGFFVESWNGGVDATYTRNTNYWRKGPQGQQLPYINHVKFTWLADPAATMAAFLAGKIDHRNLRTQDDVNTVKKGLPSASIIKYPTGSRYFWRFNTTRKPYDDPRVWKAFHLAMDYKELNDTVYGAGYYDFCAFLAGSYPGAFSPDELKKMPGWSPDTKQQDIAQAKQLMSAAGYPDGKLSMAILILPQAILPPGYDMAIDIQSQMQKVWPAMQIKIDTAPDSATFGRSQSSGTFDSIVYANSSLDSVPELIEQYSTKGSRNAGKYSNPQLDALLSQALAEFDANKRAQLIRQAEQMLLDSGNPTLWLQSVYAIQAVNQRLNGYENLLGSAGVPGGDHDIRDYVDRAWIA
jgi:ABC-type transport system substrate-binding protein